MAQLRSRLSASSPARVLDAILVLMVAATGIEALQFRNSFSLSDLLLAMALVVSLVASPTLRLKLYRGASPAFVFLGVGVFSLIGARDLAAGGRTLVTLTSLVLSSILVGEAARRGSRRFFVALVVGGLSSAAIGMMQFFAFQVRGDIVLSPILYGPRQAGRLAELGGGVLIRVTGGFGDPNLLVYFLLPGVLLAVGLSQESSSARMQRAWRVVSFVIAIASFLTWSRGGAVTVGIVAVIARLGASRPTRLLRQLGAGVVIALAVWIGFAASGKRGLWAELREVGSEWNPESVEDRLYKVRVATQAAAKSPWVGIGLGNRPVDPNTSIQITEHNTFLAIVSEMGILGLAAFVTLLARSIGAAFFRWRERRTAANSLAGAEILALVALVLMMQTVNGLYFKHLWILLGLAGRAPADGWVEGDSPPAQG